MKKTLRKILAATIAVATISSVASTAVSAYVWYSDSDRVAYHEGSPIIRLQKMWTTSTFTREMLEGLISNSSNAWNNSTTYPVYNRFTSGNGTGNINVIAGKPQSLSDYYGIDFTGSNGLIVNGRTSISSTSDYSVTINGVSKNVRKATGVTVYIMNKQTAGTCNGISYGARSSTGLQNTVSHEIGHALGYLGHSVTSGDLMAPSTSNTTALGISARDRRQVGQFLTEVITASLNDDAEDSVLNFESTSLTTEDKIDTIKNSVNFANNIIVGTPIEVVKGSNDVLPIDEEDCGYLLTEYKFKVNNYLYGNEGDNIITVRSQVGNIFELGQEYTFTANRINNTLFDVYTVNSQKWVLNNADVNNEILTSITSDISTVAVPYKMERSNDVIEVASATHDFIDNNVDVALIATISSAEEDIVNHVYDISISNVQMLKGNVTDNSLNNIRIKGNVNVGETYLMLFTSDEDGNLMMASRNGSVININDTTASNFESILVNE